MTANHTLNVPEESPAQPIELGWSSERLVLRDSREDWTGITNPTERRKLQNRLNQRARRDRARKRTSRETSETEHGVRPNRITRVDSTSKSPQATEIPAVITPKKPPPQGCMVALPEVRALMDRFAGHAYASYLQGEPAISHLSLLVRYNLATSLAANAMILGVVKEFYEWDGISPMNKHGPQLGSTFHENFADWPATLQPTQLQLSKAHHPWVDCFPWPQLRDNLLQAFERPDLCDEDELCHDICDLVDNKEPMLLIWGSPADPRCWEASDRFLRKWAWLFNGCGQVLMSTNYWRAQRGEALITPQEFAKLVRLSYLDRLNSVAR
ncbi:hypothetical protein C7974DRAFT_436485 [Boeremia exigua]|uniref:uncharacterized protein n=1 Tax=Boeremia exigua TaxID=749465 RepID=UPI001E8DACE5|nr:uncharacterized protein C7974DRAFT_436485 [Boeremia exigua]KAH6616474.1 hypothetical protein C7974DRAFT_436485 [Boeremia exigua]